MTCKQQQRILIVDDDRINRKLLTDLLKLEHTVILAKNSVQALERAKSPPPPDIILLDVMMPDIDGYTVLHSLKEDEQTKHIPVIFISALNSLEDEEKGLEMGAIDYITKPFRPAIVKARVRNHLQYVRHQKLLEEAANIDVLTELANRRRLNSTLNNEWLRCLRNTQELSLAILDIDFFKQYNDHYGHGSGDIVLKAIAGVLQSEVRRAGDLCARYGGEEFVILMPDTDATGAKYLVEGVRSRVESLSIPHVYSTVSQWVTVSIGGATVVPSSEISISVLFKTADGLLYKAKKTGRNRVIWQK